MLKIKKGYSLKIISTVVIVCFLITSLACPDTLSKKCCLRPQLAFNNQRMAARYTQALKDYVEYKISLRNRAIQVLTSLRPDIKEGENLTAQEFEAHIRILAKESNYSLIVNRVGFFNFFNIIKNIFSRPLIVILDLLRFDVFEFTFKDSDTYYIEVPGKTAFILPLIATILTILLVSVNPCFVVLTGIYFISFIFSLTSLEDDNLDIRHELKHVYIFCMIDKLKEEGLLDLPLDEIDKLFPYDQGLSQIPNRERINVGELEKIENTIINCLFPEPEFNSYKDGLPKSDIPIDKESKRRVLEIIRIQSIEVSTSL